MSPDNSINYQSINVRMYIYSIGVCPQFIKINKKKRKNKENTNKQNITKFIKVKERET